MEDLTKKLKGQGYDMIDGSSREHRILQIWKKRMNNTVQNDFNSINKVFRNTNKTLEIIKSNALNVTSGASKEMQLQIGANALDDLLEGANLGKLDLGLKIQKKGVVKISFSESYSEHIEIGELIAYFNKADLLQEGGSFLKDLNRDNFIIITTILYAKNLSVVVESEGKIDAGLDAEINGIVGGKLTLQRNSESKITLNASLGETFPIALKYHRIKYSNSTFDDLVELSDNKDWF